MGDIVNKKKIVLLISSVAIIILGIGGKMYMDKQEKIREERNQAVKEIQEQASKYVIENYVGIKKIEWTGWSVGPGPLSVDTSMIINDYSVDEGNGFFSYSAGHPEWVEKYTDGIFEFYPRDENDTSKGTKGEMIKTLREQGVRKSKEGSPNAEIIYNWEESE